MIQQKRILGIEITPKPVYEKIFKLPFNYHQLCMISLTYQSELLSLTDSVPFQSTEEKLKQIIHTRTSISKHRIYTSIDLFSPALSSVFSRSLLLPVADSLHVFFLASKDNLEQKIRTKTIPFNHFHSSTCPISPLFVHQSVLLPFTHSFVLLFSPQKRI